MLMGHYQLVALVPGVACCFFYLEEKHRMGPYGPNFYSRKSKYEFLWRQQTL